MTRKPDIIFISGIEWHGQNCMPCHHLVEGLSRSYRVFYVNNFGALRYLDRHDFWRCISKLLSFCKLTDSLQVHVQPSATISVWQPWVIPSPGHGLVNKINTRLLTLSLRKLFSKYQIQNPIIWTRLPTDLVWSVIQGIEKKLLIYQSIDRFPEHPRINDQLRTRYRESERSFNLSADLVFASARGLYDEKRKLNSKTFFIPNGVSEKFAAANCFPIASLEALNGPIVGFAGALGTATDNKLLATLAKAMPKVNFVFLGTIDRTVCLHGLEKLGNVTIGGLVSHHELISWFTYFDVGLIPYLINDFLHYTFPSKMAEYLMAGLPIVSTRLPEVSYYEEVVDIVDTVDEMVFAIQTIVAGSSRWDEELIAKRKQVAQGLSWETQVKKIEELIEGALVERSIANRS